MQFRHHVLGEETPFFMLIFIYDTLPNMWQSFVKLHYVTFV